MARVVIGVDPHKRSATIEVMNHREKRIGRGRFGTDRDGYQAMLAAGRKHNDRVWAVEGVPARSHSTPSRRPRTYRNQFQPTDPAPDVPFLLSVLTGGLNEVRASHLARSATRGRPPPLPLKAAAGG